jgi:transposase
VSATFEIPLDIADVEIVKVETNREGEFIITVISTEKGTNCHVCGRKTTQRCGHDQPITLRHLLILGKKTYIRIVPVRYACPHCKGKKGRAATTTQRLSWYEPRSPHTKAYEEQVLLSLVNSTVEDVSIKEGLGYEAVMGIIKRHIAPEVDWRTFERLGILGIDEIALKKGHKDFVVIVTARIADTVHILAVLKDRTKESVKKFLASIPKRLRRTIKAVCSDMYEGFVKAAKEVLGKGVRVIVDRFHVAKLYRKGLDDLRKRELRRLKKELSDEEYAKLKGIMWILRKRPEALSCEEWKILERLFTHSPSLKLAYELCKELTDIFDQDLIRSRGRSKILRWKTRVEKTGLKCFKTFLSTLDKHFDEITNYFISRHTSGFVEGLNNKIKVIKRRCYGLLNTEHLFQRIYLDLSGYALFGRK